MRGKLIVLFLIILCLFSVGCTRIINQEDIINILESNEDLFEEYLKHFRIAL